MVPGRRAGGTAGAAKKAARKKATCWLETEQIEALRREALRRATERNVMKPDASELVREAVAKWLEKRPSK